MGIPKRDKRASNRESSVRFEVFALRDSMDGRIVLVGHRPEGHGSALGKAELEALAEVQGLRTTAEGGDVDLVVLADDLADADQAIEVENVVVSAYRAARLAPARLVPAHRASSTSDFTVGPGFLDGEHRSRLEKLILRQHQEIADLNETLDRVRALRDLHHWAGSTVDGSSPGDRIRVEDLERALGPAS